MRRLVVVTVVAILIIGLVFAGCAAPAPSPSPSPKPTAAHLVTKVNILTAPFGTQPYSNALAASDMAKKKNSWLTVSAAESPGYIYNLQFLAQYPDRWENTIVSSTGNSDYLVSKGAAPFTPQTQVVGLRYLMGFRISAGSMWALNQNYQTMADLKGKKVALGYESQIGFYWVPKWLFENGYETWNTLEVQKLGPGGVRSLMDGLVEAAIGWTEYHPTTGKFYAEAALLELLGAGKTAYPVGITKDIWDKAEKKDPWPTGYVEAKPDQMDKLSRPVGMFTEVHHFVVKDVFPEDAAYEFVKLHLQNAKEFATYGKAFEAYGPQTFTMEMTKKNTHPGAAKAFAEAGINIP